MEQSLASSTAVPQQPLTHETVLPKKKKGGKLKLLGCGCVLLLCVIVLAIIAGLFAASQSNSNIPVLSDVVEQIEHIAKPDKVVAQEVTNNIVNDLMSLKSGTGAATAKTFPELFKYSSNLNATGTPVGGTKTLVDLTGTGEANVKKDNVQLSMDLTSTATVEGVTLSPTLNVRVFGNVEKPILYFRAGSLPSSLLGSFPDINNKWVKFDVKETLKSLNPSGSTLPSTEVVDDKKTSEDFDKLARVIKSDVIINNFKRTPDQVINGVRVNCFAVNLGPAQVQELYAELQKIYPEEYASLSKQASVKTIDFSGCVGRKDNLPYKLAIDSTSDTTETGNTAVHMEMNFKDYNLPVTIEEPKADLTFEELLQSLFQTFMSPSTLPSSSSSFGLPGGGTTDDTIFLDSAEADARAAQRENALLNIDFAILTYYGENFEYPTSISVSADGKTATIGSETVDLEGAAKAKSGNTTSSGTAYCFVSDGSAFSLGFQNEEGSWGEVGSDQQLGTNLIACEENTFF